ncbi:MAG: NUDIX domain-containing protein, partial [Actinobacteria bacterium]
MTESAGILLYRPVPGGIEVLVAHPGGPFWASRDDGAWSIPKGELDPGEDPATAAVREFEEETGHRLDGADQADLVDLGTVRQRGGKVVRAFAVAGEFDPATLSSNVVEVQ